MQKKYFNSTVLTRYLKDVKNIGQLSISEEKKIYNQILNGDEKVKELLIHSNTKYVIEQCRKYAYDDSMFDELFSEGMLGLINATNTFNYNTINKFLTYAKFHIRLRIIDYLREKSRVVRLPVTYVNKVNELIKESYKNECSTNYNDYDINQISTMSLSTCDVATYNDLVHDEEYDSEVDIVFDEINEKLKYLSSKEIYIIEHFFGINNKERITLSKLAEKMGICIEELSLIKLNALRKIRCLIKDIDYV